ncbi:MAG: hypothetical protein II825_08260 [Paludibacteraceae bacterium]|nr:hypothetical protein [Paludibacteraceae bacterium]
MKDFTLDIYRELLERLQENGYELIPYSEYCRLKDEKKQMPERFVILRHDVDAKPINSLRTAQIEHSLGARATYYFRTPESGCYDKKGIQAGSHKGEMSLPEVIRGIVNLGHEIGYHYEDMSLCGGDYEKAWAHFKSWLDYFRQYYAVETICMHGAPTSKYDSKDLWQKYDYKSLGLIGEPYLDTDFKDVFYLTDTGRCWDGYKVSVRDKIPQYQEEWNQRGWTWHGTEELIAAVQAGRLPAHVMITTHPQRWTNDSAAWWRELVLQNMKNIIKKIWIRN